MRETAERRDQQDRIRKEPPLLQAREEERLEAILDSIADGIVVTGAQRRIVGLHGSLHGLSGSLGRFCGDIFQPSSRGKEVCEEGCILSRAMEEGPLFSSPVECIETEEKVHTPVHGVAAPVRGKGGGFKGPSSPSGTPVRLMLNLERMIVSA